MSSRWIVRTPGARDDRRAAGVAMVAGAAVGGILFYLARYIFARESVVSAPSSARDDASAEERKDA